MKRSHQVLATLTAIAAAAGMTVFGSPRTAHACGCFAPPNPTVPVVQAGERILFAMNSGQVTAHIQIQYAGNAGEFGWILPLPTEPTLELGTDELFTQITTNTQPLYLLNRIYEGDCSFDPSRFFGGGFDASAAADAPAAAPDGGAPGYNPLVYQSSVGPYDYAVLKADRRDEMLNWLNDNGYFVPVGTTDVVGPYIRTGAFFLALKLRSGESTGSLQPVVVKYQSDLPMIPIVLTSVAAQPDMGIQVWMLGEGRAIPRNYYHTVINDSQLDWFDGAQNYNDVIIRATKEAPDRHTFVTEYAGSSSVMQHVLDPPGRFGQISELASQPDEISFVQYLFYNNYPISTQLFGILAPYIPVPQALIDQGYVYGPGDFYGNIAYYLGDFRTQNPQLFDGYTTNYQPAMMADQINMRIVVPTLDAGQLFLQHSYLTRLYTTLSPENMDADPVFSYNPDLPDISNTHTGTLTYHCATTDSDQGNTPATLVTEQGYTVYYGNGTGELYGDTVLPSGAPASSRIEILHEEGAPQTYRDNQQTIEGSLAQPPRPPGKGNGNGNGNGSGNGNGTGNGNNPGNGYPTAAPSGCSLGSADGQPGSDGTPAAGLILLASLGMLMILRRPSRR
jgi:hypothetical protein